MVSGERSRRRFGARAALTVAGVFLAGLLLGLGIARWRSPAPPSAPADLTETLAELDLTSHQRARIDSILTSGQGRTDRVLAEVLPRVQAVVDSVDGEIRHVLTDRQRVRLEEIRRQHVIVRRNVSEDSPDGDDTDSLGP